jgi:hypothetical protein
MARAPHAQHAAQCSTAATGTVRGYVAGAATGTVRGRAQPLAVPLTTAGQWDAWPETSCIGRSLSL